MVVRGDQVTVPTMYEGRTGTASHVDAQGRWVVWTDRGGHWAAGVYEPADVVYVGSPEPAQPRLQTGGGKTAVNNRRKDGG